MDPLFSVIIPAHNEQNYIKETVESVNNQTMQDFETIVVMNGCKDNTKKVVKKLHNDQTSSINLSNANVCAARNAGAKKAKGHILLFLDADTKLAKNALEKIQSQFLANHSVATTKVKPCTDKLKYKVAMAYKNFHNNTGLYEGCSGALVCRKEDFEKVGGYDTKEVMREHRKLTLKLKKHGKYVCVDTHVTTSMRRLQRWGVLGSSLFWIKQGFIHNVSNLENQDYEKVR